MANKIPRVPVREQDPKVRATNFDEVCYGYNKEEALLEASRCLNCRNPRCMTACPVGLQIPRFIAELAAGNVAGAAAVIAEDSSLPAVCGRVCPQETQCEGSCVLGVKGDPVAIGKLERFVADYTRTAALEAGAQPSETVATHGLVNGGDPLRSSGGDERSEVSEGCGARRKKVAVIGSGPAGLACASDLAKWGYDVTIFEALHKAGGVLEYGIPEFRLPKDRVLRHEIEAVRALGAEVDAIHPMAWTPELISKYAAVVVTEGNSLDYWQALFGKPEFRKMLSDYVQGGGALLAEIYTGRSLNANMSFFALGKEAWGVEIPWTKNPPRDATSFGFGDPRQIVTDSLSAHPIAEGVKKVQLFALTPLKFADSSRMEKVVSLPKTSSMPGACAVAAQSFGKGRVVVSADPMAFQPYRILEADNASLLLNTLGWLLVEPVTSASRAAFKDQCRILE